MSETIDSKAQSSDIRGQNIALKIAITSSAMLLIAQMFYWTLIEFFTVFIWIAIFGLIVLFSIAGWMWSIVHIIKNRKAWLKGSIPLLITSMSLILAYFVPFTEIWTNANFSMKRAAREEIVTKIRSGQLAASSTKDSSLIDLPSGSRVSAGNEIVVDGLKNNPFIFFFTFRGVLDNYSGFLWVPDGRRPEEYRDAHEKGTQIIPYGDNWYFIGHQ